jgi:hypothetical protein
MSISAREKRYADPDVLILSLSHDDRVTAGAEPFSPLFRENSREYSGICVRVRARVRAREPEVGILIEGEIITGIRSLLTAGTCLRCFAFVGACSVLQTRQTSALAPTISLLCCVFR